jgi:hypothetical protein
MQRFTQVTLGVHIKARGTQPKETRSLERTWRQGELCDSEVDEEKELPQGAKSLHSGRTCVSLRRRVRTNRTGRIYLGHILAKSEMQVCGGMCEVKPKSMKSMEMKK